MTLSAQLSTQLSTQLLTQWSQKNIGSALLTEAKARPTPAGASDQKKKDTIQSQSSNCPKQESNESNEQRRSILLSGINPGCMWHFCKLTQKWLLRFFVHPFVFWWNCCCTVEVRGPVLCNNSRDLSWCWKWRRVTLLCESKNASRHGLSTPFSTSWSFWSEKKDTVWCFGCLVLVRVAKRGNKVTTEVSRFCFLVLLYHHFLFHITFSWFSSKCRFHKPKRN